MACFAKSTQENQADTCRCIRCFLRDFVCFEERMPVADVAIGFSEVADLLRLLAKMERKTKQ